MDDGAPGDEIKQKVILKAAFGVFAQYGYRRTSMEDIARGAGVSRPALYQHFRNKEDIARSLVRYHFADAEAELAAAVATPGAPGEVLARGFRAMAGQIKQVLLDSPHGMELLEAGNTVAADIVSDGMARQAAVLAAWLEREAAAGRVALNAPAPELAEVMLAALDGVKTPPYRAYLERIDRLARLFGRGLEP